MKYLLQQVSMLLASFLMNAASHATTVNLDYLEIVKNGTTVFEDSFDNGTPPPDNPGNGPSYGVIGGPLAPETGGKLTLDASTGQLVLRPDSGFRVRQGVVVNTSRDPSDITRGLRVDDTFSLTAIFDVTSLSQVRDTYGVRLTDSGSSQDDDRIGLFVTRTSPTEMSIVLNRYDDVAFTSTDIETIPLDLNNEQIALRLSRNNVSNTFISASYAYLNNGLPGQIFELAATPSIFNGEDFTRGVAVYSQVSSIPVPSAVWLFGSGLLGLMRFARRQS